MKKIHSSPLHRLASLPYPCTQYLISLTQAISLSLSLISSRHGACSSPSHGRALLLLLGGRSATSSPCSSHGVFPLDSSLLALLSPWLSSPPRLRSCRARPSSLRRPPLLPPATQCLSQLAGRRAPLLPSARSCPSHGHQRPSALFFPWLRTSL
jgi:hypothetical protein